MSPTENGPSPNRARSLLTDAELIRQARENNAEAWNTLARRYLPLAWRYAYAQLENTHAAEDVVSETMLAFLKSLDQIDADAAKISAWLRSVVRHKVADHHRRNYRVKEHLPRVGEEQRRRNGKGSDDLNNPVATLLVAEKQNQIATILESLPERQRLALEWKYLENLRVREIASRLGETEKAVEATLYRARREFRRLYEISETAEVAVYPRSSAKNCTSGNNGVVGLPWPSANLELPKK